MDIPALGALLSIALTLALQPGTPGAWTIPRPRDGQSLSFAIVPRQERADSCGDAVLRGIAALAGLETSSGNWRGGDMTLLGMQVALARRSIPSQPFRFRYDELPEAIGRAGPVVAHFAKPVPHFVLLIAADSGCVVIADPAEGLRYLGRDEFVERWSGAVLVSALAPESGGAMGPAEERKLEGAVSLARERVSALKGAAVGGAVSGVAAGLRTGAALRLEAGLCADGVSLGIEADFNFGASLGLQVWSGAAGIGAPAGGDCAGVRLAADFRPGGVGTTGCWLGADLLLPDLAAGIQAGVGAGIRAGVWALEDPVSWRVEGSLQAVPGSVAAGIESSLFHAVNAFTAFSATLRAEVSEFAGLALRAWAELGVQRSLGRAAGGVSLRAQVRPVGDAALTGRFFLRIRIADG